MSTFDDNAFDEVFDVVHEFLKDHKVSELLKIIKEAVEYSEEGY